MNKLTFFDHFLTQWKITLFTPELEKSLANDEINFAKIESGETNE